MKTLALFFVGCIGLLTADEPPAKPVIPSDPVQLAKLIESTPVIHLWVAENREEGLIVGHFDTVTTPGTSISTSLSRVGGGGGTYIPGVEKEEKNRKLAFIAHTPTTRTFVNDRDFHVRAIENGSWRMDGSTVIPKYQILRMEKAPPKAPEKPPTSAKPAPRANPEPFAETSKKPSQSRVKTSAKNRVIP